MNKRTDETETETTEATEPERLLLETYQQTVRSIGNATERRWAMDEEDDYWRTYCVRGGRRDQ